MRIRGGDNRQMIVLAIQGLRDSVIVSRDKQEAAADRNNGSFGTALTREQVEALSDDLTEMAQQLQEMAGGGAVMRVDSFEGGQLPPKAMIKSIHVTRDALAAENHSAGGLFIDIITQGPDTAYQLQQQCFHPAQPWHRWIRTAGARFSQEQRGDTVRIQEVGPLGRRAFMNTRLEMSRSDSSSQSMRDAPTVRVNDAFTSGGAKA